MSIRISGYQIEEMDSSGELSFTDIKRDLDDDGNVTVAIKQNDDYVYITKDNWKFFRDRIEELLGIEKEYHSIVINEFGRKKDVTEIYNEMVKS